MHIRGLEYGLTIPTCRKTDERCSLGLGGDGFTFAPTGLGFGAGAGKGKGKSKGKGKGKGEAGVRKLKCPIFRTYYECICIWSNS